MFGSGPLKDVDMDWDFWDMCFCCDTSRTLHRLLQIGDVDGSEPAGEAISQLWFTFIML